MKQQTPLEAVRFLVTFGLIVCIFILLSIFILKNIGISTNKAFSEGKHIEATVLGKKSSTTKFLSNGGVTPIDNYYLHLKINNNTKEVLARINENSFKSKFDFPIGSKVIVAQYKNRYFVRQKSYGIQFNSGLIFFGVFIFTLAIIFWLKYTKSWKKGF